MADDVTLEHIRAAASRLAGQVLDTPLLALAAAAAASSLTGVTLTFAVIDPAAAGISSARIANPAGSGTVAPLTSSASVVLPSALALTLTTYGWPWVPLKVRLYLPWPSVVVDASGVAAAVPSAPTA